MVRHTATFNAVMRKKKWVRVPATTSKQLRSRMDLHNQHLTFTNTYNMKHKTAQSFIVQQIANGKLLNLHTEEITKKTLLFKNLDVPNGRKLRVLKTEFNNQFIIIE